MLFAVGQNLRRQCLEQLGLTEVDKQTNQKCKHLNFKKLIKANATSFPIVTGCFYEKKNGNNHSYSTLTQEFID